MSDGTIDLNPMEVVILAEEFLRRGWIKGNESGYAASSAGGDQDAAGVCLVGALRSALRQTLLPQIEARLLPLPEFQALTYAQRSTYSGILTDASVHRLLSIFYQRIANTIGVSRIESWNDATDRQKADVLAAMQASLETITKECLSTWTSEATDRLAKGTSCPPSPQLQLS